VKIADNMAY